MPTTHVLVDPLSNQIGYLNRYLDTPGSEYILEEIDYFTVCTYGETIEEGLTNEKHQQIINLVYEEIFLRNLENLDLLNPIWHVLENKALCCDFVLWNNDNVFSPDTGSISVGPGYSSKAMYNKIYNLVLPELTYRRLHKD